MRKTTLLILFMLLASTPLVFSQLKQITLKLNNEEAKKAIDEYIELLKGYRDISREMSTSPRGNEEKIRNWDDKEFKKICRSVYNSGIADPVKVFTRIWEDRNRALKEANGNDEEFKKLFPSTLGVVQKNLMKLLKEKLPYHIFCLFCNDLLIKGKVISKEDFVDSSSVLKINCTKLKIVIIDYIKINSSFDIGNELEIIYYGHWINNLSTNWEINKEYLFNIELNSDGEGKKVKNLLITGMRDTDGYFPINNDILLDSTNFFGLNENISWAEFKEKILNELSSILN